MEESHWSTALLTPSEQAEEGYWIGLGESRPRELKTGVQAPSPSSWQPSHPCDSYQRGARCLWQVSNAERVRLGWGCHRYRQVSQAAAPAGITLQDADEDRKDLCLLQIGESNLTPLPQRDTRGGHFNITHNDGKVGRKKVNTFKIRTITSNYNKIEFASQMMSMQLNRLQC